MVIDANNGIISYQLTFYELVCQDSFSLWTSEIIS